MTKNEAMVKALDIISGEADAMADNNLGIGGKDEAKVKDALKKVADQLMLRSYRMEQSERKRKEKRKAVQGG